MTAPLTDIQARALAAIVREGGVAYLPSRHITLAVLEVRGLVTLRWFRRLGWRAAITPFGRQVVFGLSTTAAKPQGVPS